MQAPVHQPTRPSVRSGAYPANGHARGTLVWALTLAAVLLLIPILFLEPRAPVAPDAWMTFETPDFTPIRFENAPEVVINRELVGSWPTERDEDAFETKVIPLKPKPAYDALRWLESRQPPLRIRANSNPIRYKLDPSFGFDNRLLHLDGMMLHMQIEF